MERPAALLAHCRGAHDRGARHRLVGENAGALGPVRLGHPAGDFGLDDARPYFIVGPSGRRLDVMEVGERVEGSLYAADQQDDPSDEEGTSLDAWSLSEIGDTVEIIQARSRRQRPHALLALTPGVATVTVGVMMLDAGAYSAPNDGNAPDPAGLLFAGWPVRGAGVVGICVAGLWLREHAGSVRRLRDAAMLHRAPPRSRAWRVVQSLNTDVRTELGLPNDASTDQRTRRGARHEVGSGSRAGGHRSRGARQRRPRAFVLGGRPRGRSGAPPCALCVVAREVRAPAVGACRLGGGRRAPGRRWRGRAGARPVVGRWRRARASTRWSAGRRVHGCFALGPWRPMPVGAAV